MPLGGCRARGRLVVNGYFGAGTLAAAAVAVPQLTAADSSCGGSRGVARRRVDDSQSGLRRVFVEA